MRDTRIPLAAADAPTLDLEDIQLCVDFLEAGVEEVLIPIPGGTIQLTQDDLPSLRSLLRSDGITILVSVLAAEGGER